MTTEALITHARRDFHSALLGSILRADKEGIPSNADRASATSRVIASGILSRLGSKGVKPRLAGQQSGSEFERICAGFLRATFLTLRHLRPGEWVILSSDSDKSADRRIEKYVQYQHLGILQGVAKGNPIVAASLGADYLIAPDVVILRRPEPDETLNALGLLVDNEFPLHADLRATNNPLAVLHASISCKWTIRSDRAQNARSEGLNLVKNRTGHLPHVAVVTGEPLPSRLSSIAMGTGEIDCVYHFALPEMVATVNDLASKNNGYEETQAILKNMVDGKRLRDISDLPLDLAV